jgi:hypothetical protein
MLTSYLNRNNREQASIFYKSFTKKVIVFNTINIKSLCESVIQISPKNILYNTIVTFTQAFINVFKYNNVYNPFNYKTPAVNNNIIAKSAKDVSPNKIRCYIKENLRGSLITYITYTSGRRPDS